MVTSSAFVCVVLALTSVCFPFNLATVVDSRPEVSPEVVNNEEDNEGKLSLDGLIVSGGPHYVYRIGSRQSTDFKDDETELILDDHTRQRVKRQSESDEASAPYLEKCGQTLSLASGTGNFSQPLHYSLAYNTKDNKYLIVYDYGRSSIEFPFRVIATAFNPICILTPGTKIASKILSTRHSTRFTLYQGWPAVAYNEDRNSYLVLFQISSRTGFILAGQRIKVIGASMILDGPLFRAFEFYWRGKRLSVTSAAITYSPKTRGYAIAASVRISIYTNIFMGCLNGAGSVGPYLRVYYFRKSSAYSPEVVYDRTNNYVYVIATAERDALTSRRVETSRCVNSTEQSVILVRKCTTKCRKAHGWKKAIAVGSSTLRFPTVQASWDDAIDALVVVWDTDDETGKRLSRTAIVDDQDVLCDPYQCPNNNSMRGVSLLYHTRCNRMISVWQEYQESQWFVAGSHFPMKFVSRESSTHDESESHLLYDKVADRLIAIWKDRTVNSTTIWARCLCSKPEVPCPILSASSENDTLNVPWVEESASNFLIAGAVASQSSCGDMLCYIFENVMILHGSFLRENPLFVDQESLRICMPRPLCCPEPSEGVKYFAMGTSTTSQLVIPAGEARVEVWSSEREREYRSLVGN